MNPLTFVTHPSVRIKGTENNYSPTVCEDNTCTNKSPHLHCPFCVKSETYQDPVILKAHYRVKHVDKGIEFAGLKVLRCCDHCDIVGVIKGEKKFKGAHWHCYKCRNGFNRRDEAIKHYKTHFRNPQTTFQIQIAQEVNQTSPSAAISTHCISSDQDIIHPVLTHAACLATSDPSIIGPNDICKSDGTMQVSIAANETINTADGQTIMIISEEQLEAAQIENSFGTQIISAEDVSYLDPKQSLERKYESVEIRCQRLEEEKAELKAELEQYKAQVQVQIEEIAICKRREQELLSQLQVTEQISIQEHLETLQAQHRELLQAHLISLKQAVFSRIPQEVLENANLVEEESYEIHIQEEEEKDEQQQNSENCFVQDKTIVKESEHDASDVNNAEVSFVSPCLVMTCVTDEHGEDKSSETLQDQEHRLVAEISNEEVPNSPVHEGIKGESQPKLEKEEEESSKPPSKKRKQT